MNAKDRIKRVLYDHLDLLVECSTEEQRANCIDYVAGLMEHRLNEKLEDMSFITQGDEYYGVSNMANDMLIDDDHVEHDGKVYKKAKYYKELTENIVDEVKHDGDGKRLDEPVPSHKRRVKSYGFFKNTYYDD